MAGIIVLEALYGGCHDGFESALAMRNFEIDLPLRSFSQTPPQPSAETSAYICISMDKHPNRASLAVTSLLSFRLHQAPARLRYTSCIPVEEL